MAKGTIIAIGGAEDKGSGTVPKHVQYLAHDFYTSGILYRIREEMQDKAAPIEVVTTASMIPQKVGQNYVEAFSRLGIKNVNLMHIRSYKEADNPDYISRLQEAGCVLFSGGNQFRLTTAFCGTRFHHILRDRYENDHFVVAGTSAGAMAMSDVMIYPGNIEDANTAIEVPTYGGLDLIEDVIIDTHFLIRGRFRRLSQAVADNPQCIGIGLDEDTGIVLKEGKKIEAIGSGLVVLIDPRHIREKNDSVDSSEHDIYIENLIVHVLAYGNRFELKDKDFTRKAVR